MKIKIKARDDTSEVSLSGSIDNGTQPEFATLAAKLTAPNVIFTCKGIEHVNSLGLRHWKLFVETIDQKCQAAYVECPSTMIAYAAMIPGLFGRGDVRSFFVDYTCKSCKKGGELIAEVARVVSERQFPQATCARCHQEMIPGMDLEDCIETLRALQTAASRGA